MKEFLIVDGYNIVNSWPELVELKGKSFAHAREKLVDILIDLQGITDAQTVVVFDAGNVKGSTGTKEEVGGVWVVFTQQGETADSFIERLVGQLPEDCPIYVATSDWDEQRIIFGQGAYRLSAQDLYIKVQRAKLFKEKHSVVGSKEPFRLYFNLDDDTLDTLEKLRRSK